MNVKISKRFVHKTPLILKFWKRTSITVRFKINSKKWIFYRISYEDAVIMVKERMAGIVNDTLIHQLYGKETFKEIILERGWIFMQVLQRCRQYSRSCHSHISTTLSNCVCACEKCNNEKGNLSLEEFLLRLDNWIVDLLYWKLTLSYVCYHLYCVVRGKREINLKIEAGARVGKSTTIKWLVWLRFISCKSSWNLIWNHNNKELHTWNERLIRMQRVIGTENNLLIIANRF